MTSSTTMTGGGTDFSKAEIGKAESRNHGHAIQTLGREHVELVPFRPLAHGMALAYAAESDRHQLIVPTHVVMKGGEIIGYGSLGAVKMFYAWMHTRKATPRDSFTAWRLAEQAMSDVNSPDRSPLVCMPCEASSPFAPFLAHKGYRVLGTAQITLKELKGR